MRGLPPDGGLNHGPGPGPERSITRESDSQHHPATSNRALLRHPPQCPAPSRRQGSGRTAVALLVPMAVPGAESVSFAPLSMAISIAPRIETRALVIQVYPDGIKVYGLECFPSYMGRRGKPVESSAPCRWHVPMGWPRSCRALGLHGVGGLRRGPQPAWGALLVLTIC